MPLAKTFALCSFPVHASSGTRPARSDSGTLRVPITGALTASLWCMTSRPKARFRMCGTGLTKLRNTRPDTLASCWWATRSIVLTASGSAATRARLYRYGWVLYSNLVVFFWVCWQELATELGIPFLQTSAKTSENVDAAFVSLARSLVASSSP